MTVLDLFLVRHGETDENARAIIQGWLDTPLNDLGRAQCVELGRHFKETGIHFDACHSSDLSRAYHIVLRELGSDLEVHKDARIRERNLGSLQGKPYRSADVGDAEPLEPYRARLLSFYDELLFKTTHDSTVLVTSHGGPIKQLIPTLVRLRDCQFAPDVNPTAARVYNCSVSHVQLTQADGYWSGVIKRYADVSFFPEPEEASAPGDAELAERIAK